MSFQLPTTDDLLPSTYMRRAIALATENARSVRRLRSPQITPCPLAQAKVEAKVVAREEPRSPELRRLDGNQRRAVRLIRSIRGR